VTNFGTLAILALPKMPERQRYLLLALETVTADADGWRPIGIELLARLAGPSVNTAIKARDELAAAGLIEYRRGTGPGHPSVYRLRFDLSNPVKDAATVNPVKNAATVNPVKPAAGTVSNAPRNPTSRNAATSGNAIAALEPIALEASAAHTRAHETSRRPHNRDPRLVLLGLDETVTDAEADTIAAALEADPDVRDPFAYLLAISAAGPQQIGEFLGRMRRQLAADEPSTGRQAKPPWCGECDERTRLAELPDGRMTRCIRCHPLSVRRPDPAPEPGPCPHGCDHGWIDADDGPSRRCPEHRPGLTSGRPPL
jgi:hypothetical protein